MNRFDLNDNESGSLLEKFNARHESALNQVYGLFYNELRFFAGKLCYDSGLSPKDLVHDVFISLWEKKNLHFDSLGNIKGYLYVSIRNRFRDYISHRKHVDNHDRFVKKEGNIMTQIAEPEIYSIITYAMGMLPEECARVFRLHMEGWNIKEIAENLRKSESTVYKQRQQAIDILKKKLPTSHLSLFSIFF